MSNNSNLIVILFKFLKVKQYEWSLDSLRHGHLGGHLTIAFYQWNRDKVAKCLLP